MQGPRENRLDWINHHMLLAVTTAQRSPDPNTQVGACIIDNKNRILALGYNGFPQSISLHQLPWDRVATDPYDTKYPYVVHAEANAILNATTSLEGSTIFVTLFPCPECMKMIIQKGIKKIVYLEDKYANLSSTKSSKQMAILANIDLIQYEKKDIIEHLNNIRSSL